MPSAESFRNCSIEVADKCWIPNLAKGLSRASAVFVVIGWISTECVRLDSTAGGSPVYSSFVKHYSRLRTMPVIARRLVSFTSDSDTAGRDADHVFAHPSSVNHLRR